jgi:hypothetical protein
MPSRAAIAANQTRRFTEEAGGGRPTRGVSHQVKYFGLTEELGSNQCANGAFAAAASSEGKIVQRFATRLWLRGAGCGEKCCRRGLSSSVILTEAGESYSDCSEGEGLKQQIATKPTATALCRGGIDLKEPSLALRVSGPFAGFGALTRKTSQDRDCP